MVDRLIATDLCSLHGRAQWRIIYAGARSSDRYELRGTNNRQQPKVCPQRSGGSQSGDRFEPWGYTSIIDAIKQNLTTEAALDTVVARSFRLRMRTGMFDYPLDHQP
jgi:hypothetical protein